MLYMLLCKPVMNKQHNMPALLPCRQLAVQADSVAASDFQISEFYMGAAAAR